MWRTVIVNYGERLTIKDNWLVVYSENQESRVPIGDIYALVIDNRNAMLSVQVLTALSISGAHIFYCDNKHIPVSVTMGLNTHHKPLSVLKKQLALTDDFKNEAWAKIVRQKILNQHLCLKYVGIAGERRDVLLPLAQAVLPGDKTNREAVAAKKYFQTLFGGTFRRSDDDITNAALDYGYSIIRSSVCKTLVAYGFNGVIGIHHINESDPFNLAEDIMEPLRPLVDLWVDENCDELFEELTRSNRKELIGIVNYPILMEGKKLRVRYAIDRYIKSLVSAINENNPDLLITPELLPIDEFFEDEEDG